MDNSQSVDVRPYEGVMPRLIPYNARWHKIKFALRVVSFVLAIVLLGLGIKALSFDVYPAIWFFIFAMTIASVVIAWNIAEFITLCVRDGRSFRLGIHPGAHVGVELLIWLTIASMFSVQCIEDVDAAYDADSLYWSDPADGKEAVRVLISGTVVMAILLVIHFTIFVRACIETKYRNAVKYKRPIILVPVGEGPFILSTQATVATEYVGRKEKGGDDADVEY